MKRTTKTKAAKPTKPAAKEVSTATIDAINRLNVIGKEIEARLRGQESRAPPFPTKAPAIAKAINAAAPQL
jgi:hypothetical protein